MSFQVGFLKAASKCERLPGGLAEGKPDSSFSKEELKKGMRVESEHTSNKCLRKEIAKDHLVEDKAYYSHLQKMERKYAAAKPEVAKATLFSADGNHMLMGMRNDNGKWTEPGGHMEEGESASDAILRELEEETGLSMKEGDLTYHGKKDAGKVLVHSFSGKLPKGQEPTPAKDPDKEVAGWALIHAPGKKIPKVIYNNLHVPAGKNVQHFFLGFEKGANRYLSKLKPSKRVRDYFAEVPSQIVQARDQDEA